MKGINFEESDLLLGGGEFASDLHIMRVTDDETKMPFMFAKFQLSEDELKKINETGELWLGLMGRKWPPVYPTVFHPLNEDTGFTKNLIGLPNMKFRNETEMMLRRLWFEEEFMDEEFWNEFLYYVAQKFDFMEMGEKLERGKVNGFSIDEQLIEMERIMIKVITKDQAIDMARKMN